LILPIFVIDAFTDKVFGGNPAAVIPVNNPLDEKVMQAIASENNLSETAYIDEDTIRKISPSFEKLSKLDSRGLIVSAPGDQVDFVSRCFFPQTGVNEDPVTGSAHTLMMPYWSNILGKKKLSAQQLSPRSGNLSCELHGERVLIGGRTAQYMKGEISI
jgi:predicted PhzF superfamily epimerase YddE/YHI9